MLRISKTTTAAKKNQSGTRTAKSNGAEVSVNTENNNAATHKMTRNLKREVFMIFSLYSPRQRLWWMTEFRWRPGMPIGDVVEDRSQRWYTTWQVFT